MTIAECIEFFGAAPDAEGYVQCAKCGERHRTILVHCKAYRDDRAKQAVDHAARQVLGECDACGVVHFGQAQCPYRDNPNQIGGLNALLNERGQRYGKFKDHAMIAQTLKCVMQGDLAGAEAFIHQLDNDALSAKYTSMHADQMEALEMIAHKIARILNGDPDYEDSWRDIAGYATLVADRLTGKTR